MGAVIASTIKLSSKIDELITQNRNNDSTNQLRVILNSINNKLDKLTNGNQDELKSLIAELTSIKSQLYQISEKPQDEEGLTEGLKSIESKIIAVTAQLDIISQRDSDGINQLKADFDRKQDSILKLAGDMGVKLDDMHQSHVELLNAQSAIPKAEEALNSAAALLQKTISRIEDSRKTNSVYVLQHKEAEEQFNKAKDTYEPIFTLETIDGVRATGVAHKNGRFTLLSGSKILKELKQPASGIVIVLREVHKDGIQEIPGDLCVTTQDMLFNTHLDALRFCLGREKRIREDWVSDTGQTLTDYIMKKRPRR